MRLPFLQVSQEEMARARTLAGYLGVPYAHALGMTVALKAAALEAAPDGDLTGAIRDPNPAEWMAVQCCWPMERAEALAAAMLRCGFAMAGPSGDVRVTGLEPYARAMETSAMRAEAGRRGAQARKEKGGYGRAMAGPQHTHGHGMARDAKTQTQTQKEEPSSKVSASPEAPPVQQALVVLPRPAERAKKPPTAVAQWVKEADEKRKARIPPDAPQDSELRRHQWPLLGEALKAHGALTLHAALDLFLAADNYPRENAYPLGLFVAQVAEWVSRAQANAARLRAGGGDKPRLGPRTDSHAAPVPNPDKPRL